MEITEQFILLQAPNPAAVQNGRKLSKGGKFSNLHRSEDDSLQWAECAGSGKTPYHVSIDWTDPGAPVSRCSCPSRQFPCKHALGLMFELLAGKTFEVADIPQDIADKRAKKAARAAKKETEAKDKPKKTNAAAKTKRLNRQLEGLDMAEQMVDDLLIAGIGTLGGSSAQTYEKLAKDLGNYYLTGPQMAFSRIALAVKNIQKNPSEAQSGYAEALRILVSLRSTIKKGRTFLKEKVEAGQYSAEDTVLYEALGGVWKLEDLHAIGSYTEHARILQLSFDVTFDEAKKEYIERGFWINIDNGRIDQTLNLRPVKALKYVKADDSRFEVLEIPFLYAYPGEGFRRIRWESATSRPIHNEEQAALPSLAQPDLPTAVKLVKNQIKNTLLPKYAPVMVPIGHMGTIKDSFLLEDKAGNRIVLRDRSLDGEDHASVIRLTMLPERIPEGSAMFGLMFYDEKDHSLCLNPYSIVTPQQIIRLQY